MNHRLSKAEREDKVFNLIYGDKKYFKIIGREKPDFHLLYTNGCKFGVEITEFFHNESTARRAIVPNYTKQILEAENYIHKDDKIYLPKTLASIKIKDEEEPKEIYCIFYETPPIKESISKLIKTIERKEKSIREYSKSLDHINLIIYDNENILVNKTEDVFYKILSFKPLLNLLAKSTFHEIYFITKQKEYGLGYLPLKSFFWSSIFLLFKKIFYTYSTKNKSSKSDSFVEYFSLFSKHFGFQEIFINNEETITFYYCNSKINLKKSGLELAFLEDNTDYRTFKPLSKFLPEKDISDFIEYVDSFSESAYLTLFVKINQ